MYRMIDARVKKDIEELKDRSDDDDDLWELERQMQVFDKGETMQRLKTKKENKISTNNGFDYTGKTSK